jgi:hypothetical protein
MDVGVGSFVFSLGMVSSRPFSALPDKQLPFFQRLYRASLKTLPTLALGFVRLAMVKQSRYPVRSYMQDICPDLLKATLTRISSLRLDWRRNTRPNTAFIGTSSSLSPFCLLSALSFARSLVA